MLSQAEENYLKAIFKLSEKTAGAVATNAIAFEMETKAASVTDMLKRLSEKDLIDYEKYRGVQLTGEGATIAKNLVRKHRLWEVFLVEKLDFSWDEVHEIAEQLEHIRSPLLIKKLDEYLSFPKYDPHGDPIPDEAGNMRYASEVKLTDLDAGEKGIIVGVADSSAAFLQYLDRVNLILSTHVEVLEKFDYDNSRKIKINNTTDMMISEQVGTNLFIKVKK